MSTGIGWYIHHHGSGHASRFAAVEPHLERDVTVLTSHPAQIAGDVDVIELPLDLPVAGETPGPSPQFAHWAPVGVSGLRRRMARLADWISEANPVLMVIDVSSEVAMLARLCGVPTCVIRQQGERTDLPHRLVADDALGLIAPWPRWLEPDDPLAGRTVFTGCFSRFDGRPPVGSSRPERTLVVLCGGGGSSLSAERLQGWADVLGPSGWLIEAVGDVGGSEGTASPHLIRHGWVADPWPILCGADVVISHAGQNAVSEASASRRPLIVVAEERPFGEQDARRRALERTGAAYGFGAWPQPRELDAVLGEIEARPPSTADLVDGAGAIRAAAAIDRIAGEAAALSGPGRLKPNSRSRVPPASTPGAARATRFPAPSSPVRVPQTRRAIPPSATGPTCAGR